MKPRRAIQGAITILYYYRIQLYFSEFPEPIETRVSGAYRNPYTHRIIFSLFYRLESVIHKIFLYIHESRTSIPLCSGREQILLPKAFINKRNTVWLGTILPYGRLQNPLLYMLTEIPYAHKNSVCLWRFSVYPLRCLRKSPSLQKFSMPICFTHYTSLYL